MLIKLNALQTNVQKNLKPLYILVGNEPYLVQETRQHIKTAWKERAPTDEIRMDIHHNNDWSQLITEASSYSLFSDQTFICAHLDKKSLDNCGKETIKHYLQHPKQHCLIVLHAYNTPLQQWKWLTTDPSAVLIMLEAANPTTLKAFIVKMLKQYQLSYVAEIPNLIYQYTQQNYLAAAQMIEKLSLLYNESKTLSIEDVQKHLIQQSEFKIYELQDACLTADLKKALYILQEAEQSRIEAPLILWLLSEEIRKLIQLKHFVHHQKLNILQACQKIHIWSSKVPLYDMALKRMSSALLVQLLSLCRQLDEYIKIGARYPIWNQFAQLICAFSGEIQNQ